MGRGAAFSEGASSKSGERCVAGALSSGTPVTGRTVLLSPSLVMIKVDKWAASESYRLFSSIPPCHLLGNGRHALLLSEVATRPDVVEDGLCAFASSVPSATLLAPTAGMEEAHHPYVLTPGGPW